MPIIAELASLPSARNEGPANRIQTTPLVTVSNVEIKELFPASVSRAGIIVRNLSSTLSALIFSDIAGADIADAMEILPLESITLTNIKNAMYCAVKGGVGSIDLAELESTT